MDTPIRAGGFEFLPRNSYWQVLAELAGCTDGTTLRLDVTLEQFLHSMVTNVLPPIALRYCENNELFWSTYRAICSVRLVTLPNKTFTLMDPESDLIVHGKRAIYEAVQAAGNRDLHAIPSRQRREMEYWRAETSRVMLVETEKDEDRWFATRERDFFVHVYHHSLANPDVERRVKRVRRCPRRPQQDTLPPQHSD